MNCCRHVHQHLARILHTLLPVLGFLGGSGVAVSAEPTDRSRLVDLDKSIDRWIDELSSEIYAVRRRAAADLIRTGSMAERALREAAVSADLETQLQAERILAIVIENSLEKRITAFENDIDGSGGIMLPGWSRAVAQVGDGIDGRKIFSKMYRAENALLNEYARDPKSSAPVFEQRVRAIREGLASKQSSPIQYRSNRSYASIRSSVRALLLVGSDPDVPIRAGSVVQFDRLLQLAWSAGSSQSKIKEFGGDGWLRDWISIRSTTDTLELNHLHLGMVFGVQSTVDIAERVLGRQTISTNHQRMAILCIARFGDATHIGLLEPLLENATRVGFNRIINKQRVKAEIQVRDIALAALVHITNQSESDYHLIAKAVTEPYEFRSNSTLFFENDSDREKGIEKWAVWRDKHRGKSDLH